MSKAVSNSLAAAFLEKLYTLNSHLPAFLPFARPAFPLSSCADPEYRELVGAEKRVEREAISPE